MIFFFRFLANAREGKRCHIISSFTVMLNVFCHVFWNHCVCSLMMVPDFLIIKKLAPLLISFFFFYSCLGLFCLGLFWVVLPCLGLGCLVLSCLGLGCLVLSWVIWSCLVLGYLVLSCLQLSWVVLAWFSSSSPVGYRSESWREIKNLLHLLRHYSPVAQGSREE